MKNMALAAKLDVEGRKLTNRLVKKKKKNTCEEAEGLESAMKCYHQCNRPHKQVLTGILRGRLQSGTERESHSSSGSFPVGQGVQNSRPVLSKLPIQHNRTATPSSQTAVHYFHGRQETINYGAGADVFSSKQQLTLGEVSCTLP